MRDEVKQVVLALILSLKPCVRGSAGAWRHDDRVAIIVDQVGRYIQILLPVGGIDHNVGRAQLSTRSLKHDQVAPHDWPNHSQSALAVA